MDSNARQGAVERWLLGLGVDIADELLDSRRRIGNVSNLMGLWIARCQRPATDRAGRQQQDTHSKSADDDRAGCGNKRIICDDPGDAFIVRTPSVCSRCHVPTVGASVWWRTFQPNEATFRLRYSKWGLFLPAYRRLGLAPAGDARRRRRFFGEGRAHLVDQAAAGGVARDPDRILHRDAVRAP